MRTVQIKELGRVVTGKTPSTKELKYWNSNDYQFICPPDIKNTRFVFSPAKYVSKEGAMSCKSMMIGPNSILIDCIGADLGNVALSTTTCMTNQQINSISNINFTIALPMYLYYLFSTKKDYFHQIGQNGSTMPIINKTMFENLEIQIHSLPEQHHIVNSMRRLFAYAKA